MNRRERILKAGLPHSDDPQSSPNRWLPGTLRMAAQGGLRDRLPVVTLGDVPPRVRAHTAPRRADGAMLSDMGIAAVLDVTAWRQP